LAAVQPMVDGEAGGWGYIDKRGKWRFRDQSGRIQALGDFNDNLARAEVNGRWGYINRQFELAIEPRFEAARDFENGLAAVKRNGQWGFINKAGQWQVKPRFDAADDFASDLDSKLLARIEQDVRVGYVNKNASGGIRPQFESGWPFFRSLARVQRSPSFGYIDTAGRPVWDPRAPLEAISDLTNRGRAIAATDEKFPGTRLLEPPPKRPAQPAPYPPDYQYQEVLPKADS
jgi:predicted DNA-binding WGR domain protein